VTATVDHGIRGALVQMAVSEPDSCRRSAREAPEYSRRQLLANAAIAASRVGSQPCVGERSSCLPGVCRRVLKLVGDRRIVMVRVPTNDLFRPNQFLMRLEDFASGAGDKPDCNAARDQWIEERVAG
jgi:hypothetical protein